MAWFKTVMTLSTTIVSTLTLAGCASFSPDGGMHVVSGITTQTLHKDTALIRSADDERDASNRTKHLLSRVLSVDDAVQIALLNNKGLQADYNELALAEADMVQGSLPPNPTFSLSRIAGNGASEAERQVVGSILALTTLPARTEIAQDRFRQAQLRAALETLRLAADVRRAYYRAVAANELIGVLSNAKQTAEATARLAHALSKTGSFNKLDQAREQVFYAETTADLGSARQEASTSRERLIRLLGLWGADLRLRLPSQLPPLPPHVRSLPFIEADAVSHRLDLQIARMDLAALARTLDLTQATRFVTLLDLAGIDRRTRDPNEVPFREQGFDVQFQIPVFDGGEVRVRQAAETYNRAFNRLTDKAVRIRSEARDAYRTYRSAYDIASQYQKEVLPLRKVISDEMQLRLSAMQVDVFALLVEQRQQIASLRAAGAARRDFWLAQSDLQATINGGGSASDTPATPAALTTAQAGSPD